MKRHMTITCVDAFWRSRTLNFSFPLKTLFLTFNCIFIFYLSLKQAKGPYKLNKKNDK